MKTVCKKDRCAGCMACVEMCPQKAVIIEDNLVSYNAFIDKDKCIDCNICHNVCQQNNTPELKKPISWYQGWAIDADIRLGSASGGFATAIASAFVRNKGIVVSCGFIDGEFRFSRAEHEAELKGMSGSKYVKSNPYGVYNAIRSDLKKGTNVLFIGLPCQVAAVRNYVGKDMEDSLYTVDLICHGTPSPKLLELFLKQYNLSLKELKTIRFREKFKAAKQSEEKYIETKGIRDKYTIAFLKGLTYTENCYSCQYARRERVSDITLGDSWGTQLDIEHQQAGVSLALCQTTKGEELIKNADVKLLDVDIDNAILNNQQLKHPSVYPNGRVEFFEALDCGKAFDKEIIIRYRKECIKQKIKSILIHMRLKGGRKVSHLDYGIIFEEWNK